MIKEDIRIKRVIVHILDSTVGMPVLSDSELEFGSDLADFLREHIYKIVAGDDCKSCQFYKEESEVYKMLIQYDEEYFVDISKDMANYLYQIMNSNIDIPAADLMVVRFDEKGESYLALLKMNYKEFYTHKTQSVDEKNENRIIKYKSILPTESQRLQEAAIIRLSDLSVYAIEKKYDVNGEKTNYFTYLFLKCSGKLSPKSKLSIVSRAVESVQNNYYDESRQFEANMKAGEGKVQLPLLKCILLGLMAGAFIAFGGATSSAAIHNISNQGVAKALAGTIFPVGLMMIVFVGGELFTGDCLMLAGVVDKRFSALQLIKTKPGNSIVSSCFILVRPSATGENEVLAMADCAINIHPTEDELVEIAGESAECAKIFGVDPKVAFLSYSTFGSGKGEDVDKMRNAAHKAQEKYPNLPIAGEMQFDAAVSPRVARTKCPDSDVAGHANTFIFPDINAGNIGYKIAQRLGNFEAYGPILLGLNAPINDLSRGCNASEVYSMAIITAALA